MGPFLILRRIILPQAMRAILPGISNDFISVLKGTALSSVIFVNELTFRAQQIVGQNFKFFTVFAAAGIIYLILTSGVAVAQFYLEKFYSLEASKKTAPKAIPAGAMAAGSGSGAPAPSPTAWMDSLQTTRTESSAPHHSFVICRNVQKSYGDK